MLFADQQKLSKDSERNRKKESSWLSSVKTTSAMNVPYKILDLANEPCLLTQTVTALEHCDLEWIPIVCVPETRRGIKLES